MTASATVTLIRHSAFLNRIRAYRVFVDHREVGKVKNGETTTFEVSSGKHVLSVKVDWARSAPLEVAVEAGGNVEVDCITSPDPVQIMRAGFGRPSTHLSLHRRDQPGAVSENAKRLTRVDTSGVKNALLWFVSCIVVGFVVSLIVSGAVQPAELADSISYALGQLSVLLGVVGAVWIFVRRS
jgi:hypothetical protein